MLNVAISLLLVGAPGYREVPSPHRIDLPGRVQVSVHAGAVLRWQDLAVFSGDPSVKGEGLIDWHWPSGANREGTHFTFSRPVSFVSLEAGDWGSDDDGPLELTAFDCDGRALGRVSAPWDASRNPPFAVLKVAAKGICSARYRSGGEYPGSTFIRNMVVE